MRYRIFEYALIGGGVGTLVSALAVAPAPE